MSYSVHVHIAFACHSNDEVATLARKHLAIHPGLTGNNPIGTRLYDVSVHFLDDISKRTGENPGLAGGLLTWGEENKGFNEETFVKDMTPFFRELLTSEAGGICSHEHILIFWQGEGQWQANAIEIYFDPSGDYHDDPEHCELLVKQHEKLPFSWWS